MIDCVLATDMSMHMKDFNALKQRVTMPDFSLTSNDNDKLAVIKYAFHLADISNPIKRWDLCKDWTDLLFVEFFAQGDMERLQKFPPSQFCDRHVTNVAKGQIGFLDFIIKPSYTLLVKICPKLEFLLAQIDSNK